MELLLDRKYRKETYSIGNLYVDGVFFSNTLEDTDRNLFQGMQENWIKERKVYGETAIPFGRYKITLKQKSQKYSKKKKYLEVCNGYVPRLINVPGFEGILIHSGNTPKDVFGCILVGENKIKGGLTNSFETWKKLYYLLKEADDKGEDIWITIQK